MNKKGLINLRSPFAKLGNRQGKKDVEREQGSIAVIVALSLTALIGFGALVTDVGMFYIEKARLQNAVDAAALAGAQELPKSPTLAQESAQEYASRNKVTEIKTNIEAGNSRIKVTAQKVVPTYLAKIWGITEGNLTASAKAMVIPPSSLKGAVPLSIEKQNFVYGVPYTLKSGSGISDTSNSYQGWFGPLRLSGNGAKDYETDLSHGSAASLGISQILDLETGNMSGPTKKAITDRLNRDTRIPRNTYDNYERDAPEIIYVPIVEIINRSADIVYQVKIVGFAAFFLEGVGGDGTQSVITGRFIKTLVPNENSSGLLSDLLKQEEEVENGTTKIDYGLYTPKLVDR